MHRKSKPHGGAVRSHPAPASGHRADEVHRELLSAIRAGRLTRRQFEAWHTQHRDAGRGLVITLREVQAHAHTRRRHR